MPTPRCETPHPEYPDARCQHRGAPDSHAEHLASHGGTKLRWKNASYTPYVTPPKPKKLTAAEEIKTQRDLAEVGALIPVEPRRKPSFTKHAFVRNDAKETSRLAALRAEPRSGTRRRLVYDFITEQGEKGATDDEMIGALDLPHQSVGPRRLELLEGGHIRDSGLRRPTRTGASAIVWVRA